MSDVGAYLSPSTVIQCLANPVYQFINWSGDITGNNNPTYILFDSNKSITAHFSFCQPCDTNCDGSINPFDINEFVILVSSEGNGCSPCAGDVNMDGTTNVFDASLFVTCISN